MATSSTAPVPCDLLIRNAVILTIDAHDTVLDRGAVAVRANRICDVGPDAEVSARVSPARVIDAGGAVVHPGFIDAHVHISQYTSRSVLSAWKAPAQRWATGKVRSRRRTSTPAPRWQRSIT